MEARARLNDPETSHEAATSMEITGKATDQREVCRRAVFMRPGMTAAEIADYTGLERHAASRRLPELRTVGIVENRADAVCKIVKRKTMTWWPAQKRGQMELDL